MSKEAMKLALDHLINLQPILGNGCLEDRQLAFIDPHIDCAITAIKQALAAPVQEPFGYLEIEDIESQREYPHNCRNVNLWHEGGEGMVAIYTTPPAQPAPVHPDSARIDWLTNNPLDALDIFGHVKGFDAARWIRQEIDNAIQEQEEAK